MGKIVEIRGGVQGSRVEQQERIATELKTLTRIRRKWQRTKKAVLEEQLIVAERERKPALVHKLSKTLSGKSGPKTRNHREVRRLQTSDEWRKELAEEGRGGMSAVPSDFKMEQEKWISTATFEEKEEPDQNACEEARELTHSLAKRLTTCDQRKVAPSWSAPKEL